MYLNGLGHIKGKKGEERRKTTMLPLKKQELTNISNSCEDFLIDHQKTHTGNTKILTRDEMCKHLYFGNVSAGCQAFRNRE